MNIIHQDGKRYAPTGERRPPKKGEWFMSEIREKNYIMKANSDAYLASWCYRDIYVELPLERDHAETLLNALSLAKENDELKAEIRRLEGIIECIARKLEELKNGK